MQHEAVDGDGAQKSQIDILLPALTPTTPETRPDLQMTGVNVHTHVLWVDQPKTSQTR